jgi:hypothetical protein
MTIDDRLQNKTTYRIGNAYFIAIQYGPNDWELYRRGDLGRDGIGGFKVFSTGNLYFLWGDKGDDGRHLIDPNDTGFILDDIREVEIEEVGGITDHTTQGRATAPPTKEETKR